MGIVVLVVVAGAAFLWWPRGATPVTEDAALEDFRERSAPASEPSDELAEDTDRQHPGLPAEGVYLYDSEGFEEVKLGPLPAEDRRHPETVSAVVVDAGDGCVELSLNLLEQHVEDTTYCASNGELRMQGHRKHQQVGAFSPTAELVCQPAAVLVADGAGSNFECTLRMTGGLAELTASVTGTSEVGPATDIEVGGTSVGAIPLTVVHEVSGDLSGRWVERMWLAEQDRLPLRIERQLDLQGPARFTERSELQLRELAPRS